MLISHNCPLFSRPGENLKPNGFGILLRCQSQMEFQSTVRAMMRPHTAPPAASSFKAQIDEDSNFKVCVRIRPESSKEKMGNYRTVVQPLDQNVLVFDPKNDGSPDFNSAAGTVRKNPRVLEKRARFVLAGGHMLALSTS